MGGSLQSMTTLSGVATMAGVSFQTLEQAVEAASLNVQKSTKDGFTPGAQALKILGLDARELQGLSTEQWFSKVADAVSRFNPSLNLTTTVQAAFGRGITSILPLLLEGSDGFDEMRQQVEKAQAGLAEAIPGISETKANLDLLSLSSRAFGAQVFSVLKPAIDGANDWFIELRESITPDMIRNAANSIANALIDIAAAVARFMAQAGVEVDQLKQTLNVFPRLGIDVAIEGPAEKALEWMARLSGNYDRLREMFAHPIEFTIGQSENFASRFDAAGGDQLGEKLKGIEQWAQRAHDALNTAIPASGTWSAVAQDMTRLNTEVQATAESFTKLNAPATDFGIKTALAGQSTRIDAEISAEQAKLARIKQVLDEEAAAFKITEQQKAVYTETAIAQAYQAELNFINQKIALYGRGTREYEAAEKEKAKLTADYEKQMQATVQASSKEMTASITQGLQTVTGAFNSQRRWRDVQAPLPSGSPMTHPCPALPEPILAAFAGRTTLGIPELAPLLDMDVKTLRRHIEAGELVGRLKGTGRRRHHGRFCLADIERFWNRDCVGESACQSIGTRTRHSGNSISRSMVIAFPDRPKFPGAKVNVTRRPSRKVRKSALASSPPPSAPPGQPRSR